VESIPQVQSNLLRHALIDIAGDNISIFSEQLSKVKAHQALEFNILFRLLLEEALSSIYTSHVFHSISSASNEKTPILEVHVDRDSVG
jgi:hypothetical protein